MLEVGRCHGLLVVEPHDDYLLTPTGIVFCSFDICPSFILLLFIILLCPQDSSQGGTGLLLILQGVYHSIQEGEESIDPLGAALLRFLQPVQKLSLTLTLGHTGQAYADRGGGEGRVEAWVDGMCGSTALGEDGSGGVWGTKVDTTENKSGQKWEWLIQK